MKECMKCKIDKPLEEFHNRAKSKDGKQSICKSCNIARVKVWQASNPERHEANWKNNSYGEQALLKRRASKYGLSVEQLLEMLKDADGLCNICKRNPVKWLVVDHCHSTLKVRGVLCEKCNQALGLLDDNIEFLESAINYLQK